MRLFFIAFSVIFGLGLPWVHADDPQPTPTPDPSQDLAAFAKKLRIDSNALNSNDGEIHITNDTLVTTKEGGTVSVKGANPRSAHVGAPVATSQAKSPDSPETTGEQPTTREGWQKRHRELTARLKELHEEIATLSKDLPEVWSRFYREDDPDHRDRSIKTELDELLVLRVQLIQTRTDTQNDLELFFNEARRAGALPGWFRPKLPQPGS